MTSSDQSRARRFHRAAAVVAVLSIATPSIPRSAFAQASAEEMAQARQLFNKGRELRDKGDLKGALEKFKAAHAIGSTPLTGFELGKTYLALNQLVEAREAFLSVVRLPVMKDESKNSANARKESEKLAEELKTRIPTVHLAVTGVPAGGTLTVKVDGKAIPAAALDEPVPVDPGAHTVVATVEGTEGEKKADVELKEGETKDVALDVSDLKPPVKAPPPPPPVTPPPPAPSSGPSALTWIGFGVGAVGIVAGSVTGLMSLSKASKAKEQCDGNTCPSTVQSDVDSSKSLGTISTISFAVGIVGVGVGVVGLLTSGSSSTPEPKAGKAHVTPWVGFGSVGLSGSF